MRRLLWIIAAGLSGIAGVRILGEPACQSVSFGRAGGRRVNAMSCFADDSGALPAELAGIGLLVIAVIVIALAFRRPRQAPVPQPAARSVTHCYKHAFQVD